MLTQIVRAHETAKASTGRSTRRPVAPRQARKELARQAADFDAELLALRDEFDQLAIAHHRQCVAAATDEALSSAPRIRICCCIEELNVDREETNAPSACCSSKATQCQGREQPNQFCACAPRGHPRSSIHPLRSMKLSAPGAGGYGKVVLSPRADRGGPAAQPKCTRLGSSC
jgi:hypothetical protein